MRIFILLIICFLSFFEPLFSQKERPFQHLILGSQYSFIRDNATELPVPDLETYRFTQHLLYNYIATNFGKRWQVGFDYMFIFTQSTETGNARYYSAGANVQFNVLKPDTDRHRLYLETGLHRSNYCSCSPEAYKKDGILYYSLAAGYSFRILPSLFMAIRYPVFNFAINHPRGGFGNYTVGFEFGL
jgi:hypothetical protein